MNSSSLFKAALGDIAKISSGGTPSRSVPENWNGNIPWVKTAQIQNCRIGIDSVDERITEEGLSGSSAKMVRAGTILMAMYGQGKTRGQVAILEIDASINQACAAIELSDVANRDYVFQYLLFSYDRIRQMSNTGGQENLSSTLIKEIPILLPPLPEQKAIADVLSTWDAAIEKTERLIEAKERRFRGLMQELIGEAHNNSNRRESRKVKIGEVCEVITSNVDKKVHEGEMPVRLCNYMDVYRNYYITQKLDFMSASASSSEIEKYQLRVHDVILTKDSETADDIANSACVLEAPKNLVCGYHLAILRPDQELFGPYLNFALHTPRIRYEFSRQANGVTRFGLTMSAYNMVELALPPWDEQKAIAETLTIFQEEMTLQQQLLKKYKTQKRGLMQKLLIGEWRVEL